MQSQKVKVNLTYHHSEVGQFLFPFDCNLLSDKIPDLAITAGERQVTSKAR